MAHRRRRRAEGKVSSLDMAEHTTLGLDSGDPALLLVDGHNLLHRAAFGFPTRIRSRSGKDRTMVFGFMALLRAAMRQVHDNVECVVVFDGSHGADERRLLEPNYKPPFPDSDPEAFADLPVLVAALARFGVKVVEFDQYEADDVIATSVRSCVAQRCCLIMSTDRDFYQLLQPGCWLLNTARRASDRLVGADRVLEQYGVTTHQWCDYRALVGDPSDGIPGVRGVGPARARSLLGGGIHLEDLTTCESLLPSWIADIVRQLDQLLKWRDVMRLRDDLAVTVASGQSTPGLPPAPEVLAEMGLWE
jgi:5'-3' exonuclease